MAVVSVFVLDGVAVVELCPVEQLDPDGGLVTGVFRTGTDTFGVEVVDVVVGAGVFAVWSVELDFNVVLVELGDTGGLGGVILVA